jgi:hypothetical protein
LLSDFVDNDFEKSISFVSKKHDLHGIRIFDQFEDNMFSFGLSLFFDPETESYHWVDTSSQIVRDEIQMSYKEKSNYFRTAFLKTGASLVDVSTQDSYIIKLLELFQKK